MAHSAQPSPDVMNPPLWDEKRVDYVLHDPVRRRLLIALARGKPLSATSLSVEVGRTVDGTYKRLVQMRSRGWLVMKRDPQDDRRTLCELVSSVPVKTTPTGKIIDFGYVIIRVK